MSKLDFHLDEGSQLLHDQLAWYERALATSQDALWHWNLITDALAFSTASHTDLGYPNNQKPKSMTDWCKHIHPDDVMGVRHKVVAHLKNTKAQFKLTFRIRAANSDWLWVMVTGQVTERNHTGRALHCMGHMQKIEAQGRIEQELFKTRHQLNLALRSAKCGFWNWNLQNDQVEIRIYHDRHPENDHELQQSRFENIQSTIHPDDFLTFNTVVEAYRQGQTGMIEGVWRVKNRNGGYRWILNRGEIIERDENQQPLLAVGTHTDITTQKLVEADLHSKTELLNLAFNDTYESLWDWNPASGSFYVSDNWLRALGFEASYPLLIQEMMKQVHANDVTTVQRHLDALLSGIQPKLHCEFRILINGIGYIWILMRGHVVSRSLSGKIMRVVGTLTNISSLKEKALQLLKNENQLELAMRGSNSSLFDINLVTSNYEIRSFHETAEGIQEKIDHALIKDRLAVIHPNDRDQFSAYLKGFDAPDNKNHEATWRSREFSDGYRWLLSKGRVASRDGANRPIRIVGTLQDIHDQVIAEQQAALEHERLQYAFEGTGDAVWDLEIPTGKTFVSSSWIESLGYNPNTWRYDLKSWGELIHPEDKPAAKAAMKAHYSGETALYSAEYRVLDHAGNWNWTLARGKVIERDNSNQPLRIIGTLFNINNRKMVEQNLASAKELAETTLHAIADAVITTDKNGLIQSINKTAELLIAHRQADVLHQPLDHVIQLYEEGTQELIDNPALFCMTADLTVEMDVNTLLKNHQDEVFAVQCKASPIHGQQGKPIGAVLILQDVTASRDLTREIEHRSKHDPLTGLINRYEFEMRLQYLFKQSAGGPHALCYLDLDQFKLVNDTCGHMAGDELLRQLSAELSRVVRHTDSLGRLGGDEFALLMEDCPLDQAFRVAKQIHKAVTGFNFSWDDKNFKLGVSIGLVSIDSHTTPQLALQQADAACFVAKEQGRNRIHVHQEDDDRIAMHQGEMGWIPRLHRALDEDLFVLYSQAIIDLQSPNHDISHFEILIRMKDGDQTIPPGAFLPAAERYNLSPKLDQWVIIHTLRTIRKWCNGHHDTLRFNINLSAHSLNEHGFLSFIQQRIKDYGVDPSVLCFEITETAAISNLTQARHFIDTMKALGCEFALDDFGSGLSSFAYLKNFPVDYLKIDGAFIRELVEDPIDLAMVKSINEIGQIMNKKTVAEWVENQAIADKLAEIGVNYAQGYHFSKPEPFDEALARMCPQTPKV